MKPIKKVAKKYHINKKQLINYGPYIAKIEPILTPTDNKLILVTAISPTNAGEGKTTVSIGLNDGLNALGYKSIVSLREPSLGPVFGMKGGAHGGGESFILPAEEIDIHFTGDFHALTAANNLISAIIDNNIYWDSSLDIDPQKILWTRCLDMNDRSLRNIEIKFLDINKKPVSYNTNFVITVASELMAIFCLSKDKDDFIQRIESIIVAYSKKNKPITLKELCITEAIMKILSSIFNPNLVQTNEGNLALVHGGPFANIAHGCSSVISLKTAMNLARYTITEAGFGSDLGAEKFFDIICRQNGLVPNCVVLVASIRSLKYHAQNEDQLKALKNGFDNLIRHMKSLKKFTSNIIVALNCFSTDTSEEILLFGKLCKKYHFDYEMSDAYNFGSEGISALSEKVVEICENKPELNFIYSMNDTLETKINKITKEVYQAKSIVLSKNATLQLKKYNLRKDLYVCFAKTPISFTDDPKILQIDKPFDIHVQDILVNEGSKFAIIICNNIFRMPGLPLDPIAVKK